MSFLAFTPLILPLILLVNEQMAVRALMLAGVTPQYLREGNLSGMNEVVLRQGGVGGKNPEKL